MKKFPLFARACGEQQELQQELEQELEQDGQGGKEEGGGRGGRRGRGGGETGELDKLIVMNMPYSTIPIITIQ